MHAISRKFESRENEAQKIERVVGRSKGKLNRELSQYSTDLADYNIAWRDFNRRKQCYGFLSQSDFYSQRQASEGGTRAERKACQFSP